MCETLYTFYSKKHSQIFLSNLDQIKQSTPLDLYTPVLDDIKLKQIHEEYKLKIQYPMSLKKVRERALSQNSPYYLLGHFIYDLQLIVQNVKTYNANKQDVLSLLPSFEAKITSIFPEFAFPADEFSEPIPPIFLQILAGKLSKTTTSDLKSALQIAEISSLKIDLQTISKKRFWRFTHALFAFQNDEIDLSEYAKLQTPKAKSQASFPVEVQPKLSVQEIMRRKRELGRESTVAVPTQAVSPELVRKMSPLELIKMKAEKRKKELELEQAGGEQGK